MKVRLDIGQGVWPDLIISQLFYTCLGNYLIKLRLKEVIRPKWWSLRLYKTHTETILYERKKHVMRHLFWHKHQILVTRTAFPRGDGLQVDLCRSTIGNQIAIGLGSEILIPLPVGRLDNVSVDSLWHPTSSSRIVAFYGISGNSFYGEV